MSALTVDPELRSYMRKLTPEERSQLEANLLSHGGAHDPILVWDGVILDGHNRHEICSEHGLPFGTESVDLSSREDALQWVIRHQLGRRNLTPAEVALYVGQRYRLESQGHGGDRRSEAISTRQSDGLKPAEETAERLAREHGMSPRTVERHAEFSEAVDSLAEDLGPEVRQSVLSGEVKASRKDLVELAKDEDLEPEEKAEVLEQAKESRDAGRSALEEKRAKKRARVEEVLAKEPEQAECVSSLEGLVEEVQSGIRQPFGTIYADPPWKYGNQATRGATNNHYVTMTVEDIAALPVEGLAADDANLHLWTTNVFLRDALEIMEAWGFRMVSMLVWCKKGLAIVDGEPVLRGRLGMGNYWRVDHELMLLGVRGSCTFARHDKGVSSLFVSKPGRHSEKPAGVRDLISTTSPGPRIELFAREAFDGWTAWGNEVDS